jgi:hypothetical protein
VFAAIAAVASVVAARAAAQTVRLAERARREDQMRRLAEALIEVMIAAEDYPRGDLGAAQSGYEPFDNAQRQLKRATGLSILGLSASVSEPVTDLMEKDAWKRPDIALYKAHKAYEQLGAEADAVAEPSRRRSTFWRKDPS